MRSISWLMTLLLFVSCSPEGDEPDAVDGRADELVSSSVPGGFAPAMVRTGPKRVDVFQNAADGSVSTRFLDEESRRWSPWGTVSAPRALGSALTAAMDQAGHVRLFARHPVLNTVLTLVLARVGDSWAVVSDWKSLAYPGLLSSFAPAATVDPDGVIHLFASDRSTQQLIHTSCILAANCAQLEPLWAPWEVESLRVYSAPSAVSLRSGEFDLAFADREARPRSSSFRDPGAPWVPGWGAATDLALAGALPVFESNSATTADWTVATAVGVDSRQGSHHLHNLWVNPSGANLASGSCGGNGAEAIARLELPATARVHFDTATAPWDTIIYVRTAAGAEVVDLFGAPACNDDFNWTLQSALDLTLPAGSYLFYVDGYSAGGGANQKPLVTLDVRYVNAPVVVARDASLDVFAVAGDGRLVANTRLGTTWLGQMNVDAFEPSLDGTLETTVTLAAVRSSSRSACSVLAGKLSSGQVLTKACGEIASFTLLNTWGARFDSGQVPARQGDAFWNEWGQLNAAWNQSTALGGAATSSDTSRVSLTARWPSELLLLDFDDSRTSWAGAWDVTRPGNWASVAGHAASEDWLFPDFGEQVSGGDVFLPGGARSTRLIDHGSCVTRLPWNDGLPDYLPHNGVLNFVQSGLDEQIAIALRNGINGFGSFSSIDFTRNRFSPAFTHFTVDPVVGNHSDGLALSVSATAHGDAAGIPISASMSADAHYVLGLRGGVPVLHPLSVDATAPSSEDRDPTDPCQQTSNAEHTRCMLANVLPSIFTQQVAARATAVLGDPMAAASCVTTSDCAGAPSSLDGDAWVCRNGRCLVAIQPTEPGYVAAAPGSSAAGANFRTEFDTTNTPLAALYACEVTTPGTALPSGSLSNCQKLLATALQSRGIDATTASAWAFDPSMVANGQFGCVEPARPNCGGDASIPGYWCHGNKDGIAFTGALARCTWRPAFRRLNVLPEALELVWSESGEGPSISERIVNALQPSSSCMAPTPLDQRTARPVSTLTREGTWRSSDVVWPGSP